jgi:3-oxoadipate enol-lactonase
MPLIESQGADISYAESGRKHGPPLLLLNALGTSGEMWSAQLPAFERSYRIVRFDARGHGKSTSGLTEPTGDIATLARDALAVLDRLEIARAHWCGLSLGGMVAMWVATNHPQRVAKLILSSTSAHMGPPDLWQQRIELVRSQGLAPIAAAMPGRWFSAGFVERHPREIERIAAMVRDVQPAGYIFCCEAIRDMDQRETIGAITAPTLVIAGAVDPGTTVEHAEGLTARIAGSDLLVLDASHLANVEASEDYNEALLRFLAD